MSDLQLETPRLTLRPLTLGDVGAVRALLIDPDVRRWLCDGRVFPEATVRKMVLDSISGFHWSGAGLFAVRSRHDGELAAYAGLARAAIGGLELVAAVSPRHWRHGVALEACNAVLADSFARLELPRVLCCADAPNFRSLALIARLGFRPLVNTPGAFGLIRWFVLTRTAQSPRPFDATTPA